MNTNEIIRVMGYSSPNTCSSVIFNNNNTPEVPQDANPMHVNPNMSRSDRSKSESGIRHPYLNFAKVVASEVRVTIPLWQRTMPKIVGGKIDIIIREEEYANGLA